MAPKDLATLLILAASAGATAEADEALAITHDPRPCILAGEFARIEARVEPVSDRARVRVFFRREGEARFYEAAMRRDGGMWIGVLPRPAAASRISYFIAAAVDGSKARLPAASAFLADVVRTPCAEGTLPVSAEGPQEIGVPAGAPQTPPGFERRGIAAFVEGEVEDIPTQASPRVASVPAMGLSPVTVGSRVRVVSSKNAARLEGKLASLDAEALVVETDKGRSRILRSEVESLEVKEKDSTGMRVLGGLAGAAAGFAVSILVCVSGDGCDSIGPVWIGVGLGALGGAALTGSGDWKPVALMSVGPLDLAVRPRWAGAAVELRVGF